MPIEKKRKPRKSGRPSKGYGILFEVRTALEMNQQDMAVGLGYSSSNTVARAERAGRLPKNRSVGALLLGFARQIPARQRSAELQTWIETTAKEFEKKPLGSVFL